MKPLFFQGHVCLTFSASCSVALEKGKQSILPSQPGLGDSHLCFPGTVGVWSPQEQLKTVETSILHFCDFKEPSSFLNYFLLLPFPHPFPPLLLPLHSPPPLLMPLHSPPRRQKSGLNHTPTKKVNNASASLIMFMDFLPSDKKSVATISEIQCSRYSSSSTQMPW